jgi:hypothetical protein
MTMHVFHYIGWKAKKRTSEPRAADISSIAGEIDDIDHREFIEDKDGVKAVIHKQRKQATDDSDSE